ncbi:MAG: amidohydrolase family protein [Promethearchaeati archaeon]
MSYGHMDFEYIDSHVHLFPPKIFKAIWEFFERRDVDGKIRGWPVKYKLPIKNLVEFIAEQNVKYFTTYNYAHKRGFAEYINEWIHEFALSHKNAIPFGCVWPEDKNRFDYIKKIFDVYGFQGIKIQPLVQKFYPFDERLDKIYKLIVDRGKWVTIHAGTAPYRNKYVGYKNFVKLIKRYPNMNIIVAHMGAFEYQKFLQILNKYENLYLDTTMIFIPDNIFPERKVKQPTKEQLISYQDRILFGSDFPNIPYEYKYSTQGLLEFDLSRNFYENIFFNNAKKIFQIS